MCGFFQVVSKNKPINKSKFMEALNSMKHRGPDAQGVEYKEIAISKTEKAYLGFGHQRLSILDLDKRSNQPFIIDNNVLLYNGEIYNYKEIQSYYKEKKIEFRTEGDTETLINSLIHNFDKDIPYYNGMWSFCLTDLNNKTILVSRDRYGKKPLFYYLDKDILCISSTIRAIKIYLDLDISFNKEILAKYMLRGVMFPQKNQKTHFENINQIIPGHNGYFDIKSWSLKQKKFFNHFKKLNNRDLTLKEALSKSVSLRLTSDRPIALLLSGGIDSSLILSILYSLGLHENVTVFMGETGRSEDYKYAKMCVNKLGINAKTIVSDYGRNAFERFLKVCYHHEKAFPFNGNAIAMPQMYEEVSLHNIPVVLDGSGGDEIFGGYWERHIPFAINDALEQNNQKWIDEIIRYNPEKKIISKYLKDRDLINKFNLKQNIYHTINPFIKLKFNEIFQLQNPDPLKKSNMNFNEALCADIAPGGQLGEWLWHNDRNSMLSSVESRSPFLDFHLHQFIFSNYYKKYNKNKNKSELRDIFNEFTPLPTQNRVEKQGFRWDGKHFFKNNKEDILEIIKESTFLDEILNKNLFLSVANKYPKLLRSSLGKRALCIAGIENSFK